MQIMPDYRGGSIVNLMSSIVHALGGEEPLYAPLVALPPGELASRNVVLLVVDGLGYEYLRARGPEGGLARRVRARITSVFPSTTASAVTTFLTGTAPQQHGLTGWFMYFAELGGVMAVLPYRPRHGGSAPRLAVGALLQHVPVFDRLDARAYMVAPARIANSDFNLAHRGRAELEAFGTLDEMFQAIERIVHTPGGRTYVYAYWPELDRLAHEHGVGSREVSEHLDAIDAAFEAFLGRIAGSDTTVIVTADHGFIDAAPAQAIDVAAHPALARTLLLPPCGEQRAAYCYVRPQRQGAFADYVARFADCAELHEAEALVAAGAFGLGAPHPRLHERIGDYVLIMKQNAVIKDWLPGERPFEHIGVHGSASPQEMYVPLIVAQV